MPTRLCVIRCEELLAHGLGLMQTGPGPGKQSTWPVATAAINKPNTATDITVDMISSANLSFISHLWDFLLDESDACVDVNYIDNMHAVTCR